MTGPEGASGWMADTIPVNDRLFAEGDDGEVRLRGGRCDSCRLHHFPSLPTCPYCSSEAVAEAELSPEGTLWGWTAVTAAPPGYRGEVPYGFGVVELPEGLRVITRLTVSDPSLLRFGQAMRLVVVPLHEDDEGRAVVTYAFAPSGGR
jgi:uncharacterized OB-fold protein